MHRYWLSISGRVLNMARSFAIQTKIMKRFHSLLILIVFLFSAGALNLRAEEGEDFSPDFESVTFVPKGQWITGVSVSYSQSNQKDYQFLVLQGVSGDTYSFKLSPMVMYAFKNDMAAGIKFGYNRNLTKLENAEIAFSPDMNLNVDHLYRLAHNYYGMGVLRNYFSLGTSKRFGLFTEVQLEMGGGQAKLMTGLGEDLTGNYERNFNLGIGVAPGLAVFLNNFAALEVNVGVLGFDYNYTKTITDQIYVANRNLKSAIFRVNLFSITFGVAFYL